MTEEQRQADEKDLEWQKITGSGSWAVKESLAGAESWEEKENRAEDQVSRMLSGSSVRHASMTRKRKEKFDFWQIYGIVVGILIVVIGGCLGYLWQNLVLYERSVPAYALEQYRYPLVQGGLPKLLVYEAARPAKYETALERDAYIRELLTEGEWRYSRLAGESDEDRAVYLFEAGSTPLAAVTLERIHAGRFGHWEAVLEESRLPIFGDIWVTAPSGTAVTVNGIDIFGEDRLTEDMLQEASRQPPPGVGGQSGEEVYYLTGLYRKPEISAMDASGNAWEVVWQEEDGSTLVRITRITQTASPAADAPAANPVPEGESDEEELPDQETAPESEAESDSESDDVPETAGETPDEAQATPESID
ncbi:MAG: hypothetical protein FWH49_08375 [Clostridiales bacterium]|nr:hypothetical protein [Clostridiales bacterium]MCL2167286.1 hypothetical protein [Clostridiales bacterium]